MAGCCSGAIPRFSAVLPNYQLVFAGWSRQWRGSTATVRRSGREKTLGGVYEISEQDLSKLDRIEGVPAESERIRVTVFRDTGESLEAWTHLSKNQSQPGKPSSGYLEKIKKAYLEWGLV